MDAQYRILVIFMIVLASSLSGYVAYNGALNETCKMIDSESRYINGECVKVVKNDKQH